MLLNKRISIGYFLRGIQNQILFIGIFAVTIGLLDMLPWFRKISLPLNIPALLGTAVSLLLAFRISQSYERWWEARTVWGAIVNDSRSLVRLLIQFMPAGEDKIIKDFAERQIIWTYALGESLRKQPFSERVQQYLKENNISALNIPNALLDAHSRQLKEVAAAKGITDFQQMQLNDMITRLCDSMGKCERLKNTVFPRSYSVLVHILIYVFAAILPFGLDDSQLAVEIGITFLIPIVFITIEKTSIIMQDPFENTPVDTPMTSLAQTIEINIRQMIGEQDVPLKKENTSYYEM
ncbi:bestrophin family protein [Chryseobacterium sp. BIGb0232]|uniref:bestrophin family protein n=1 Tax=Chryseobacterium sp. BIGb0232 TaxID=2940598 RepID=UPI000F46CECE|nr:bestrophin family ion channel [Chryseobacterium sp. BIGb0232]MCS4303067.1 putative membrane protein [Chryseobacterium sp. BIGb0232]ROS14646.1 putative membrane protein [Chryseobacterium nakagawai]